MCQLTQVDKLGNYTKSERFLDFIRGKLRYVKQKVSWLKTIFNGNKIISEKNISPLIIKKQEISVGDTIQVRPKNEIRKLLGSKQKYKGCPFTPEMYDYCEKTYKVFKEINYFYDEVREKLGKCKDLVILEGVTCSGKKRLYFNSCDLNCNLFWHKDWLTKL